ncbi:hypothetical protein ACXZ8K_08390 [Streptococcus agalactiae]|nr:hypothetical protein [Streptococcus agalactiae]
MIGTNWKNEGQNSGTEYSLSPKEEYLGNVPIGQWVHEQEQGGLKPPPCNPVTMSPDIDYARKKKEDKKWKHIKKE